MDAHEIIVIENGVTRNPIYRLKEPINLRILEGEHIAIVGANGAGKSLLVDTIIGRYPLLMNEVHYNFSSPVSTLVSDNIKYVTFRDSYGEADNTYYYQQRWNAHDIDDTPIVRDLLPPCNDKKVRDSLYELFGIGDMLDKHIVLLSSGELRKFQLTKTLLSNPRVLILDNPFIGLDVKTRVLLHGLLQKLIEQISLQVILVLSKTDEIPDFITHVIPVSNRTCGVKISLQAYLAMQETVPAHILSLGKRKELLDLPCRSDDDYCVDEIVSLRNVSIIYGERIILKNLNWTIKCGEKWALTGDNGSGKSTLLSLICADNPQSYACDISLFGRKRGTGESIWEIKKHIGYVSPEMHRAYMKNLPAIDIVASGLYDTIGLYKKPTEKARSVCEWWMHIFGIEDLKGRNFLQLSSGEQRMVLLVRAFVKDPELLILDEPLHGLDVYNRRLVKDIIEAFCHRKNKTLVMVTHYKEELPDVITDSLVLKRST